MVGDLLFGPETVGGAGLRCVVACWLVTAFQAALSVFLYVCLFVFRRLGGHSALVYLQHVM